MREVRVYDGDFPTIDQMLSGDPAATFPKECWIQQMSPGEFAVHYRNFKTGGGQNPSGLRNQSSEICRIFGALEEAREDSRKVVEGNWTLRCFIYDHTGALIDTVSNNVQISKVAAITYAGILLWIGMFALVGMAAIWLLNRFLLLMLGPSRFLPAASANSGWVYWGTYTFAGLLLGVFLCYFRLKWTIGSRVSRVREKLGAALTPEDKKRFADLNHLYGSTDPATQERYKKLFREYQEMVAQALKK